jgi:hypothetical protein
MNETKRGVSVKITGSVAWTTVTSVSARHTASIFHPQNGGRSILCIHIANRTAPHVTDCDNVCIMNFAVPLGFIWGGRGELGYYSFTMRLHQKDNTNYKNKHSENNLGHLRTLERFFFDCKIGMLYS